MSKEDHSNISRDSEVANKVLAREARRRRTILSVSLPVCLLIGVALFSSMAIESIYVVSGGAVAGLVVWACLINLVPLERGSWAYKLLLAGDRTASEEATMTRIEVSQTGHTSQRETKVELAPPDTEPDTESGPRP